VADIHLEKRERSPWPVVLAVAVLLALLIWWLLKDRDERTIVSAPADTGTLATVSTGETGNELPTAVAVFLRWSDERRAPSAMNPDHSHVATGIRNLAAALEALAARAPGIDIEHEMAIIRRQADTLRANVASSRHADVTRKAFLSLSGLMAAMRQELAAELRDEIAEVRRSAEAVRPEAPLLDQREHVQDFFDRSANVVRQMAKTSAG
jgi:hypothetical protein